MSADSVRDRIQQEASRALLRNAVFRLESALMVGGAILATVFLPQIIPWLPSWAWPLAGALGEVAIIISSLTDKAEQRKVVESLFREKYSIAGFRDRRLQDKLSQAEEYRGRIQEVVDQQRSGVLRDRLVSTTAQIYDWIANMVALARRIDAYRSDEMIQGKRRGGKTTVQQLGEEIGDLEKRLARADDRQLREQLASTLESKQQFHESLRELDSRMQRADLQLDHSLAALGTVYSQLLLIGSKDVDSDRADRLRDDIRGQVLALDDIVDSLNEVYGAARFDEVEPDAAPAGAAGRPPRREQSAGR